MKCIFTKSDLFELCMSCMYSRSVYWSWSPWTGAGVRGGVTLGASSIQIPAETWCDHKILCVAERNQTIPLGHSSGKYPTLYPDVQRWTVAHIPLPGSVRRSTVSLSCAENKIFPFLLLSSYGWYNILHWHGSTATTEPEQQGSPQTDREVWSGASSSLLVVIGFLVSFALEIHAA